MWLYQWEKVSCLKTLIQWFSLVFAFCTSVSVFKKKATNCEDHVWKGLYLTACRPRMSFPLLCVYVLLTHFWK